MIRVVNMIPASLSGEANQDSEPNLAVNVANTQEMVGTAFTPSPMGGGFAPIYVTTDGGATWSLRSVVPGNGFAGTGDITVGFSGAGGMLYAGTLNGTTGNMQILRTSAFASTTPMTVLVDRASEDQPWVVVGTIQAAAGPVDRVYVGNNDFNQPAGRTATVDVSLDARTAAAPAGFAPHGIERRATSGQDGPPIREALHPDGTVYAVFQRWVTRASSDVQVDVVVTRDDAWGGGGNPFANLVDSADGAVGQRVATAAELAAGTHRFVRFNAVMGNERLGADLAIAVDPVDSSTVWVAWCDRVGGAAGTDWTVHVRRSTDRGQTWSGDLRTITNAKNPTLALSAARTLGLAYQAFTGSQWSSRLEMTADAWATAVTPTVMHTAPSTAPARVFFPYLGDYIRLLAIGDDFYGVFSGNNTPDMTNFPNGVTYQRRANWTTHTLLATDGVTPVATSIDPFFFHWTADRPIPIRPRPRVRDIQPRTVEPTPVSPRRPVPVTPTPRSVDPIQPTPPRPIVRDPGPLKPAPGSRAGSTPEPEPELEL